MFAKIEPGLCVRVISGPLAGVEGTVLTKRCEGRSVIALDLIQKGVTLETDDCRLAAIGERAIHNHRGANMNAGRCPDFGSLRPIAELREALAQNGMGSLDALMDDITFIRTQADCAEPEAPERVDRILSNVKRLSELGFYETIIILWKLRA